MPLRALLTPSLSSPSLLLHLHPLPPALLPQSLLRYQTLHSSSLGVSLSPSSLSLFSPQSFLRSQTFLSLATKLQNLLLLSSHQRLLLSKFVHIAPDLDLPLASALASATPTQPSSAPLTPPPAPIKPPKPHSLIITSSCSSSKRPRFSSLDRHATFLTMFLRLQQSLHQVGSLFASTE